MVNKNPSKNSETKSRPKKNEQSKKTSVTRQPGKAREKYQDRVQRKIQTADASYSNASGGSGYFYVPYFYCNTSVAYKDAVNSFINQNIHGIYMENLNNYRVHRKAKIDSLLGTQTMNGKIAKLDALYDALKRDKALNESVFNSYSVNESAQGSLYDYISANKTEANDISKISEVVELLSQAMEVLSTDRGYGKQIFDAYRAYYQHKFLSDPENANKDGGEIAREIMDGIMAANGSTNKIIQYDEQQLMKIGGITKQEAEKKIDAADKKMMALIAALDIAVNSIGGMNSRVYDDKKRIIKRDGKTSEYNTGSEWVGRILEHIEHVIRYLDRSAHEVATANALKPALDKIAEGNKQVQKIIQGFGAVNVIGGERLGASGKNGLFLGITSDMIYKPSTNEQAEFDRYWNMIAWNKGAMDVRVSKGDVSVELLTKGSNSVHLGISVKKYPGIKIKKNGKLLSGGAQTISLQSGTPFPTMLLREAGASMKTFNGLVSLAAGHTADAIGIGAQEWVKDKYTVDETGSYLNLDADWEKMRNVLAAKVSMTSLVGLLDENVVFMQLNGHLYNMDKILSNLVKAYDRKPITVKYNDASQESFTRTQFLDLNIWVSDKQNSRNQKHVRSKRAYNQIINKMYSTKLEVEIKAAVVANALHML